METRPDKDEQRRKRKLRYRDSVTGTADRPRLCVFRSLNHIYAQAVDDANGRTIAAASTRDPDVRTRIKTGGNVAAAKIVGETIAGRLKEKGVPTVTFDRGGYLYHGRVKALADGARHGGLKF
jgi:large subunit ribosomal protein L18